MINSRSEALEALKLDSSATDEDIKKTFRKLAAKMHPDVSKEPDAEEKYKKISAAYEYLKNPPPQQHTINMNDFVRQANSVFRKRPEPVYVSANIFFKESILGCQKNITLNYESPCIDCNGNGRFKTNRLCSKCEGRGYFEQTSSSGNQHFSIRMACGTCSGAGCEMDKCTKCSGEGSTPDSRQVDIKIPGGIGNGQVMRLRGCGNVYVHMGGFAQSDAFLTVNVKRDPNMRLSGHDVISNIDISLYEAVAGTSKDVKTVLGDASVKIKPGSKNKDQVSLPGHGVNKKGNHIFTLNVKYPKDLEGLVEFLKDKE